MIHEYQGYQIKPHKEVSTMFIIVTAGKGGKIPDVLDGVFTSVGVAMQHIDKYVATKPRKDKDDDETRAKS